jgi:tetratricopeptide (TPR) repeat protein
MPKPRTYKVDHASKTQAQNTEAFHAARNLHLLDAVPTIHIGMEPNLLIWTLLFLYAVQREGMLNTQREESLADLPSGGSKPVLDTRAFHEGAQLRTPSFFAEAVYIEEQEDLMLGDEAYAPKNTTFNKQATPVLNSTDIDHFLQRGLRILNESISFSMLEQFERAAEKSQEAIDSYFAPILKIEPTHIAAHAAKANCLHCQGVSLLKLANNHMESAVSMSERDAVGKEYDKVIKIFQRALKIDETNESFREALAVAYHNRGENTHREAVSNTPCRSPNRKILFRQAEQDFREALKIDKKKTTARENLVAMRNNQIDELLEESTKLIYTENLTLAEQNLQEAEALVNEARAFDSENKKMLTHKANIKNNLGAVSMRRWKFAIEKRNLIQAMKDIHDAEENFRQAMKLDTSFRTSLATSLSCQAVTRMAQCEELVRSAFLLNSERVSWSSTTHQNGLFFFDLEKPEPVESSHSLMEEVAQKLENEVISYCDEALTIDPENPHAKEAKAKALDFLSTLKIAIRNSKAPSP